MRLARGILEALERGLRPKAGAAEAVGAFRHQLIFEDAERSLSRGVVLVL